MFYEIPDQEHERWLIENLAQRFREKFPVQQVDRRRGHAMRRRTDLHLVALKLASLQKIYDRSHRDPNFTISDLYSKALVAVWPLVMPYRWPISTRLSRYAMVQLRKKAIARLFQIGMMAMKDGLANYIYDYPILSIQHRAPFDCSTDISSGPDYRKLKRQHVAKEADEAIGRAVLQEYRRHPPERRSLESAQTFVASLGCVDGIDTGSKYQVRKRYLAFRTEARERGYADRRAFWCEFEQRAWPSDQVWMEDFPIV